MRSRGGGSDCRFRRAMLDKSCYRSVPSMLLPSNITRKPVPEESLMPIRSLLALLLALVVNACGQSNGSEKKSGHPGIGMPPTEESGQTGAPRTHPLTVVYGL